jgi:pimeloyl-ACP methyl ester carboxylesterase
VTLDLAGHGESGRGRKSWTIEAFADDVVAVADALKLTRLVLVGHSMGGPVSLAAAPKLGDRLAGIVAVDTLLDLEERIAPAEIDAFLQPFEADYPAAAERFVRQYMIAPSSPAAVVEAVVARARSAPKAMAIASIRSSWSYDAAGAADRVKAPIRAINGERYPTNVEANRRHAPGYAAAIITGVGHYPMLEAPERFGEMLEAALRALLSGAPR